MIVIRHLGILAALSVGMVSEPVLSAGPTRSAVSPEQHHKDAFPADKELQALLKWLVEQEEAKGIVLGLLEPNGTRRIVYHGDAGQTARPLSSRTTFEIGSITKTFVGAILADMVRRGEVSLDDPVSKYLPEGVIVPSRNSRIITLLDLATHRSGLPSLPTGFRPPNRSNPFADYRVEHLYEFLSRHELERDIGAKAVYSNLGMGLLGHALARAAGAQNFPALVQERVAEPLGLKATAFVREGELNEWMAKGHDRTANQTLYWDIDILAGAGGLNSNVEDMLTYLDANVGQEITPLEAAMREAHRPRGPLWDEEGWQVGLAWQARTIDGKTIINHGGETAGFVTYLGFDPNSGAGVVIFGNSSTFDAANDVMFGLLTGKTSIEIQNILTAKSKGP